MSRLLPPNASLRYVRTEAKDSLKAHKQGSSSVCRLLRNLHRFGDASDDQILTSKVSLQEVQFALAIDYGFSSWKGLQTEIESRMQSPETAAQTDARATLPNARRFENSDSTLSHMRCIRYVLEYHGQTVDWNWLMGVSGEAFCFYFHPTGTCLTQHVHSWDSANAALEAYGYVGRWTSPAFTNDIAQLLAPFRTEIAKGNPVIAPGIVPWTDGIHSRCDHWYVVVGVDIAAGRVIVAGHAQDLVETVLPIGDTGPDGPHPCWYGIIRTFAPGSKGHYGVDRPIFLIHRTVKSREAVALAADALRRAVALAREESATATAGWGRGTYLAGHKALRALRDTLASAEGDGLEDFRSRNPVHDEPFRGFANELEFLRLLSERRLCAAEFLRQASGLWSGSIRKSLSAASELFRQSSKQAMAAFNIRYGTVDEHDRIRQFYSEEVGGSGGNAQWDTYWARADAALASVKNRLEMAGHLDRVLEHEQAAIDELESAIKSIGPKQRIPAHYPGHSERFRLHKRLQPAVLQV